jgi:hypothetical protein
MGDLLALCPQLVEWHPSHRALSLSKGDLSHRAPEPVEGATYR